MRGQVCLYLDQWGNRWFAGTVEELRRQIGGRVSKMYVDTIKGETRHVGYVVGPHWCQAYLPFGQTV